MGEGSLRRGRTWRITTLLMIVMFLAASLLGESARRAARAQTTTPPNIVLIVTDDQRYDSLAHMPNLRRLMIERGMRLDQAIVSNPICCPSRATILTGRYSHSTGVYTNIAPNGGWPAFHDSGAEASTIATALDDAGYRTGLIGKYLNDYDEAGAYVPPGWDRWFAFADHNGRYYNYTIYDDSLGFLSFGDRPRHYSTDVIRRRAVRFVRGTAADTPLFLMVTPYAPHAPAIPAARHEGDLAEATFSPGPAVNEEDVSDKPAYIQSLQKARSSRIRSVTIRQWETLLAVDELVAGLVQSLRDTGRLGSTLLIFTSDNGLANWEHRWRGKHVPYEEAIRVPFIARLDGEIPQGTVSTALASNVDIAPTIADLADVGLTSPDGVSLLPLMFDDVSSVRDSVLLEMTNEVESQPEPPSCGVRTRWFTFVRYATGEEELYDFGSDPWQLQNVALSRPRKANELRDLTISLCQPTPPGFSW